MSENKIVVLTNNVILIGRVKEVDDGIIITKPNAIKLTPTGKYNDGKPEMNYELSPFLQEHTGQSWDEMPLKDIHILTSATAEKNDLLDNYLQLISGIQLPTPGIIT